MIARLSFKHFSLGLLHTLTNVFPVGISQLLVVYFHSSSPVLLLILFRKASSGMSQRMGMMFVPTVSVSETVLILEKNSNPC